MFFFSSIFSQNMFSLEYSGGDSLAVVSFTESDISGFQFVIEGIEIIDAHIPEAISSDFQISFSSNTIDEDLIFSTVLVFQMTGAIIPSGNNILAVVFFNAESVDESICFETECFNDTSTNNNPFYGCALSDPDGQIIPLENYSTELDYCVEGCFNETACNFLETNECEFAVTYYEDADNDTYGNLNSSQALCEAIDGWVINSEDEDDTCSGTISEVDGFCCLSSTFDDCGVCDGDGTSCTGCDGIVNSGTIEDACEVCAGDGTSCEGCDGIANSGIVEDACGNCGGDCIADNNGTIVCSGNISENLVIADCFGVCSGTAAFDDCTTPVCSGGTTGLEANASCTDCFEVVNGTAYIDSCDICVGGDTGESECLSLDENIPHEVSITSTYPNPFNPSINIEYSIASVGHVNLQIIGLEGKQIETITNSIQTQGLYNVQWAPINVSSGMYLIQLKANNQIQNKKILYLK